MSAASPEVLLSGLRAADLDRVLALERELFGAEAWSRWMFTEELRAAGRHYLAALAGDELVGYGGLCAYPQEAFIQTMAVAPAWWGRGLGSALLAALLAEAARRGHDEVLLEVRVDNERAQRLYRRFGFAEIGRRRGYYQPSNTDALVMAVRGVRESFGDG